MPPAMIAIYGSPRRNGNTALLLKRAVLGARDAGADVEEFVLRDLTISPCLEIYACEKNGECAIKDDFQMLRDKLLAAKGLMMASPMFFYTVSAHSKIMMDRFQSLWVKKYILGDRPESRELIRKGLFISVGGSRGKKLFDGAKLTMRYFFDTLDMSLWKSLTYRGIDKAGDINDHPEYLAEAYETGKALASELTEGT